MNGDQQQQQQQEEQPGQGSAPDPTADVPQLSSPLDMPVDKVTGMVEPRTFREMWQVCVVYSKASLVPKDYRQQPSNIFLAWQRGRELGLSLGAALENIAVINGTTRVWGDALLAIVENSGLLEEFEEHFEGEWPKDDFKAVCMTVRAAAKGKKARTKVYEYTVADAKTAGLFGQNVHKTNPKRMLQMRARGFNFRDNFADVLRGVHSHEEMEDAIDITPTPAPDGSAPDPLQGPLDAASSNTRVVTPPVAAAATGNGPKTDAKPEAKGEELSQAIEAVNGLIIRMNAEVGAGKGLEALKEKSGQANLQGLSIEKLREIAKHMEAALDAAKQQPKAECICDPKGEVGDPECKAAKHKHKGQRKLM